MEKSSLNNSQPLPEKDYFNKILIKLAIIIFALLIIFLVVAYLIQRSSKFTEQNPNEQNLNDSSSKAIAATLPSEAATIYQRSGTITEIQAGYLVMQSRFRTGSSDPRNAYTMRSVTVYVDANTVYTKKSLTDFKQTKIVPSSQPSSKSELGIGDTINVRASVNIKNSTSFTATAIEKITP